MGLLSKELWVTDCDKMLNSIPFLSRLENNSILVTGATGLICSTIVDLIARYNISYGKSIDIYVAARDKTRVEKRFEEIKDYAFFHFLKYDATIKNEFVESVDYIIHGASNADPVSINKEPVETMVSNFNGMYELLNFAHSCNAKRILYISSSEIYGLKDDLLPYKENEYGFIDLLNPRNSYSLSKRATENLLISYSYEYGVESVIARPGHIYGPTASQFDSRISSEFVYKAARGEPLVMNSEGTQVRSYCHCLDCASAILYVLLLGKTGEAYNISNPNSIITIKEMAEIISRNGNVDLRINVDKDTLQKRKSNPMSNSSLDSSKLEQLGWNGTIDAEYGFSETIKLLK